MRPQLVGGTVAALAAIGVAAAACAGGSSPGGRPPGIGSRPARQGLASPAASGSAASPVDPTGSRRHVVACTSIELGARFAGGGFGGGNDFGGIWIWNPGPRPCRLSGAITFTAYYAGGAFDRNAVANRPVPPLSATLPARMPRPHDGADPSAYLIAFLMGPERDDPTQPDALCRTQDKLSPATLVLSIGTVTVRVANNDPGAVQNTTVYGCHGRVLFEDVRGPLAG
jgi:hypothetical protein